jgi:hypothetical protein
VGQCYGSIGNRAEIDTSNGQTYIVPAYACMDTPAYQSRNVSDTSCTVCAPGQGAFLGLSCIQCDLEHGQGTREDGTCGSCEKPLALHAGRCVGGDKLPFGSSAGWANVAGVWTYCQPGTVPNSDSTACIPVCTKPLVWDGNTEKCIPCGANFYAMYPDDYNGNWLTELVTLLPQPAASGSCFECDEDATSKAGSEGPSACKPLSCKWGLNRGVRHACRHCQGSTKVTIKGDGKGLLSSWMAGTWTMQIGCDDEPQLVNLPPRVNTNIRTKGNVPRTEWQQNNIQTKPNTNTNVGEKTQAPALTLPGVGGGSILTNRPSITRGR